MKNSKDLIIEVDDDDDDDDNDLLALEEVTSRGGSVTKRGKKPAATSDSSPAENDSFDIILPPLLGSGTNGECNVMIQVDPEDAALLDYEGISGAIGRFEADDHGGKSMDESLRHNSLKFSKFSLGVIKWKFQINWIVVLDLKGCQYQGSILPGPTALVVGLSKGGQLRVEGVTNEFATFVKTQDIMAKLDAVVEGEMDDGFTVQDENVNKAKANEGGEEKNSNDKGAKKGAKRSTSSFSSKPAPKRRKANPKNKV